MTYDQEPQLRGPIGPSGLVLPGTMVHLAGLAHEEDLKAKNFHRQKTVLDGSDALTASQQLANTMIELQQGIEYW